MKWTKLAGGIFILLMCVAVGCKKNANTQSDMVLVPAGEFVIGSNSGADDEQPEHRVYLDAFYIDKYEVTVDQYDKCVQSGKCTKPDEGGDCNWGKSDRGNHPINCVDWDQARTYCEWVGKRLPTEAEWEKAARGTDWRKYPWGDQDASCNYAVMDDGGNGCGKNSTWPVGSKPNGASPYGAMDMAGNVGEWVADRYGENYYKSNSNKNPKGPADGNYRVYRGGSWNLNAVNQRSSSRGRYNPVGKNYNCGFRCAGT